MFAVPRAKVMSALYRKTRRHIIDGVHAQQEAQGRPRDLEEAVEIGDARLAFVRRRLGILNKFPIPQDIGSYIHDLYFPSPIIFSSFKDDIDAMGMWLDLGVGGGVFKTAMEDARQGNARPRLQEIIVDGQECLINAMGLPGKDARAKIGLLENSGLFKYRRPLGFSVGGSSIDEYMRVFTLSNNARKRVMADDPKTQVFFEINISCPNTAEGQDMARHPSLLAELLKNMRYVTDGVIGVKLSPDFDDVKLRTLAETVACVEKTYVNLGNTSYRSREAVGLDATTFAMQGGGLSGSPLYARTFSMVHAVRPVRIPIVATGGVQNHMEVLALLRSGASLVGMVTALVCDPYRAITVNNHQYAANQRYFSLRSRSPQSRHSPSHDINTCSQNEKSAS